MNLLPTAIEALVALLQARPELDGTDGTKVPVLDGQAVVYAPGEYIVIGPADDGDGVDISTPRAGLGARRDEEAIVTGLIWSGSGTVDLKRHRDRAFDLLGVVRATLDDTAPGLNRAITRAEFSGYRYRPVRSAKGTGVLVPFSVGVVQL